jgi:ABC-type multidrug transport system ATPase subunit
MTEPILEIEDLTKRYKGRPVVNRLSMNVERGDIFGFLGRNGAGKSTTLRMVLGLVRPTSGSVRLVGHDMARHSMRALARVGAIIESPAFYEQFSGRQNLKMFAAMSGGATSSRIEHVLEIVGLRSRAEDAVRVYSHGMRQRLGIAQALLPDPDFIILDEPTDGLDPQGILEMRLLIRRLKEELGLTIMLSSHLLYEVEQICNRIAIIEGGNLIYQGSIEELVAKEKTIKLKVDRPDTAYKLLQDTSGLAISRNGDGSLYLRIADEEIPVVNSLLVEHGLRVFELSPQRETLEQVFFRLTNGREARARTERPM